MTSPPGTADVVAGWYPDPTSRFEVRYHNGRAWTADVASDGERYVDPMGTSPGVGPHRPVPPGDDGSDTPSRGATASMVLGIVSIVIGWLPFVAVLGGVAAIVAVVLGVRNRRRLTETVGGGGRGAATAGLVTGSIGLLVAIGGVVFTVAMTRALDAFQQPAPHEAVITACDRRGDEVVATGELTNTGDGTESFTVRVFFVRPGTDNPQRQATVVLTDVRPGERAGFDVSRRTVDDLDCIVGVVRGPLPFGVDPGN